MTPEEAAIERIEALRKLGKLSDTVDTIVAIEIAIEALKEIQQYREIGTMEECREAVEKQKSEAVKNKKLLIGFPRRPYCIQGDCPKCGCKEIKATDTDYCYECGQHLKWDN